MKIVFKRIQKTTNIFLTVWINFSEWLRVKILLLLNIWVIAMDVF